MGIDITKQFDTDINILVSYHSSNEKHTVLQYFSLLLFKRQVFRMISHYLYVNQIIINQTKPGDL